MKGRNCQKVSPRPADAAAVPAGDDGRGDAPRLDQEIGQAARRRPWPRSALRGPRRTRSSTRLACHRYPIFAFSSAITSRDGHAVGAGGEGERHAVLQHRLGERRPRRRARARSGRRSGRGRGRRASAPGWRAGRDPRRWPSASFGSPLAGPGRADEIEDRLDHRLADRHAADELLDRLRCSSASSTRSARASVRAGGLEQHAPLGLAVGIDDVDLQQEAVELRLGKRDRCPPARAGSAWRARGRAPAGRGATPATVT